MTNKAYVEFYIDWYCMFHDLYEYEVNLGSGLYGDFRKEFQPYFRMIRNNVCFIYFRHYGLCILYIYKRYQLSS
ncbi:hypothetical protein BU012_13610 [Mammaliicoccus sciuri]|nr:hypothetical protein BU012_13610 [Mammaliicoccus sciuri]